MESGFGSPAVAAAVSWRRHAVRMLEVEAALALAHADAGLIDGATAAAIVAACRPDNVDFDQLAAATALAVTPVIPLLAAVRQGVAEADLQTIDRGLHQGATSQDVVDTAAVLCIREALDHVEEVLGEVADVCASLADMHRAELAPGRTLGQHAVPITFGLRAARWLGAVDRRIEQLRTVAPRLALVQVGGAAGTRGAFHGRGDDVAAALGRRLSLGVPDLPWHAERDRIVELAGALAGVATTVGGIAGAVVALAGTDVGEVEVVGGAGSGSTAMPHKRNPSAAVAARAASRLAVGEISVLLTASAEHEHERAAGAWQAEWVALRGALVRTGGAVERTRDCLASMAVVPQRGRRNLEVGLGLVAAEALAGALADPLGRPAAERLVGHLARVASEEGRQLHDVARTDPSVERALSPPAIDAALDPASSLSAVDAMIDRAIATDRELRFDRQGHPK